MSAFLTGIRIGVWSASGHVRSIGDIRGTVYLEVRRDVESIHIPGVPVLPTAGGNVESPCSVPPNGSIDLCGDAPAMCLKIGGNKWT